MCYLPQPSASADNTNLCLNNSSYPTRPHSIIIYIPNILIYICVQSKYPIAKFNNFLLEMCNFSNLKCVTAIWKESDINNVAKSIRNDLCEKFTITWKDQIQQYRKLQVFKLVKPSIELEKYLSLVKIVKHRQ